MFLREPWQTENLTTDQLNLDNYLAKSTNDRNFANLLREYLLKERVKQNLNKNYKYYSFPPGSLVYLKNFSFA
jgi:hypothetical protein